MTALPPKTLEELRKGAALTQAEFANAMGVPFRTYQDLEQGKTTVRPVHMMAAYWALVTLAANSEKGICFLPGEIGAIVRQAASKDVEGQRPTS